MTSAFCIPSTARGDVEVGLAGISTTDFLQLTTMQLLTMGLIFCTYAQVPECFTEGGWAGRKGQMLTCLLTLRTGRSDKHGLYPKTAPLHKIGLTSIPSSKGSKPKLQRQITQQTVAYAAPEECEHGRMCRQRAHIGLPLGSRRSFIGALSVRLGNIN